MPDRRAEHGLRGALAHIGRPHDVLVDVGLAAFMLAMLVAMELLPGQETIPYHFLFVALALVYGFHVWPVTPTLLVTFGVTVSTGWVLYSHWRREEIDGAELAEVPLMPLLFLAMVWHARRRVAAQQQVELMADQRRASLEREREFFRDASHAIRTPVTIARGHIELIEPSLTTATAREDADVVLRQLDRMSALSNRLLALAQLDSGGAVKLRPLELSSFLEDVGRNWVSSADRNWVISCQPTGPVAADPEWLELAIDALVENAVHFTVAGDRIQLSCGRAGDQCIVAVADSGPGLDPDDVPFVFDRFWHRRPADGPTGGGLGLPMARAVASAHHGSVTVATNVGGGALFKLSLPGLPTDGFVRDQALTLGGSAL